jgi:putative PIG3 family NAD(P)H quinone oxidoreductase
VRAVIFDRPGGPEVLRVAEVPDPVPGPEDLLVRNFAAGLNRADLLQRQGRYPPPRGESEILGLEFAGEVEAAGPRAPGFARGDRVFGLLAGGGCAELVKTHHRMALPIPDNFSYEMAAAVPEAFFTAEDNLFAQGGLASGETVLVHAGASGVGTAAIQLARDRGARVIATAGSAEKVRKCLELGAHHALDRREDFAERIADITGGAGVQVILDLVGASHWERNLRSLATGGCLLLVGLVGGAKVEADLSVLLRRRLRVIGSTLRGRSLEEKIAITSRFRTEVLPRLEAGAIRPIIDRVFPLEEVRAAHERMEANLNVGKVVLRI